VTGVQTCALPIYRAFIIIMGTEDDSSTLSSQAPPSGAANSGNP
jgi:hypothetical protein